MMNRPLRLACAVRVLAPAAADDRTVDVVASTDAVNTYGYVIEQSSWQLDRFRANPVVFYDHAWDAPDATRSLPIGRAESVRVEAGSLRMTLRFASADANPLAEQVFRLFREGMLHAVSVGFTPTDMRVELRDGVEVPVFERCELLEVSVVPIPADPGAVRALALSAAGKRAAGVSAARSRTHMKGIALALGLREDAGEGEIVARAAALSELARLTAAGSPSEALGVVTAWKGAAERLPKVEAELASAHTAAEERERAGLIERLRGEKKITPAMEAWAKGVDVAALRAFASAAAPIANLSAAAPEPKDEAGAGLGRRWEDVPRMERHRLAIDDPATYRALYEDHMRRGGR